MAHIKKPHLLMSGVRFLPIFPEIIIRNFLSGLQAPGPVPETGAGVEREVGEILPRKGSREVK